jgi:heme exporter protein C
MLFSLFFGLITFTLLFLWLVIHRQRSLALEDAVENRGLDAAIEARREEAVS